MNIPVEQLSILEAICYGMDSKDEVKAIADRLTDDEWEMLLEMLNDSRVFVQTAESAARVFYLTDRSATSFRTALQGVQRDGAADAEYEELFGITAGKALELLGAQVLNEAILDVIFQINQPKRVDNPFA